MEHYPFSKRSHGYSATEMQKLQSGYYRHGNLASGDILRVYQDKYHVPDCRGYATLALTYQPYSVMGDASVPFHFTRHTNGAATQPLYLTIMALDQSGDLTCNSKSGILRIIQTGSWKTKWTLWERPCAIWS